MAAVDESATCTPCNLLNLQTLTFDIVQFHEPGENEIITCHKWVKI